MNKLILLLYGLMLYLDTAAARIESGGNITITTPVHEDLYVAGGTIVLNAPVYGDITAVGGTIQINDSVMGDIMVAGGNVMINGYVSDDIRCIAGSISILKEIEGDVVVSGGNVSISSNVVVGSIIASGGDVIVNGHVKYNLRGLFGKLTFNGIVSGSAFCRGGYLIMNGKVEGPAVLAASDKLFIGDSARFTGRVNYWSSKKHVEFHKSTITAPVYDETLKMGRERWYFLGFTTILTALWYLSMAFLMVFVVQYFFARVMQKSGKTVSLNPWKSLWSGLLFFLAVPVFAAIICLTIIGLPLGIITILSYMILLMLATVISSVVLANWITQQTKTRTSLWRLTLTGFGVFFVLKIVSLIPGIGWLFMFGVAATCFGAILKNIEWRHLGRQPRYMPAT